MTGNEMPEPDDAADPRQAALEEISRGLGHGLEIVLAFAAGFTLVATIGLMLAAGGGREHLANRLGVAVMGMLALGGIDHVAFRLARRRLSPLEPDPPGYRQFVVWSSIALLLAGVLLLGLAWFL